MGRTTGIEWTDATWNPIRGCTRVSKGCENCYAERVATRFSGPGAPYEGLVTFGRWNGNIRFVDEHVADPLKWKTPMRIFVNSMSDLFHPGVTAEMLASIFDVMARTKHTFQILTKRPDRMKQALDAASDPAVARSFETTYGRTFPPREWHFGVSIEDRKTANERLPILAACKAATRIVSYEPAIGGVDFLEAMGESFGLIDWVIAGGESGANARPMHIDWARNVRDLCKSRSIPFFFKQWGEWAYGRSAPPGTKGRWAIVPPEGFFIQTSTYPRCFDSFGSAVAEKIGKKESGSSLDGLQWKEFPR